MASRLDRIKESLRDAVPLRYQVPLKYYYNSLKGFLEPEMQLIQYLVKHDDLVIDVGGNRGIYTYYLYNLGCIVKVFEPNSKCLPVLKGWVGDKEAVSVYAAALSNKDSVEELFVPVDDSGLEHDSSASIKRPESGGYRRQMIHLQTMDSFAFTGVSFIKIDVEGHERKVIEGAAKTISISQPVLLVEIEQRHSSDDIRDIFESIKNLGYEGFFLKNGKLSKIENFNVTEDQVLENFNRMRGSSYINNFLFLPGSKTASGDYDRLFKKFGGAHRNSIGESKS